MRRHIATGITLRVAAGAALIAATAFAVFAGAPAVEPAGQAASGQTLTIIATWTSTEGSYFQDKVLRPFESMTGIHVSYTGTRALDQLLGSRIQQGNPPDLAILSSPATLLQYEQQGYLQPLGPVIGKKLLSEYGPQWQDIMTLGTTSGKLYVLPFKTQIHNLVWYDPKDWPAGSAPPSESAPTWSQLITMDQRITAQGGTPWCVGLDSTPVSGWPATDWIGDILLHQAGIADYEKWANGELPWNSAQVKRAWQTWGGLVTRPGQVYGGSIAALVTGWDTAGEPMFAARPGCYLQHAPSFVTLNYHQYLLGQPGPKPETRYDFFPFPMAGLPDTAPGAANGAWEVSADLLAMFRDTPAAERLVRYLAGEGKYGAQQIWPHILAGGALSANLGVPLSTYPGQVAKALARTVTSKQATLCFNASDEMPDTLQNAFYQGVMEYLQNPGQLNVILGRLEKVRESTYTGGYFSDFSCGSPSSPARH